MDLNSINTPSTGSYYGDPPPKSFFDNLGGHIIDFIQTLVVFGAIFAILYLFVAQFHKVSGNSMFPTYHNGDFLITEKITYRLSGPKRGDVIILKNPRDESQDFIKRIIALPGDSVKVENDSVYINGVLLDEPYLPSGTPTHAGAFFTEGTTIKADSNQYFVFGDNRNHSSDSREWGAITKQEIIGRAFFRYWPPQSLGLLISK
jgi:signal peptidase I